MPYYVCPGCGQTGYSTVGRSTGSRCTHCSLPLSDDARVYPSPDAGRALRRVVDARPEAVADARGDLDALALPVTTRKKVELLISELVTNSVLHAGSQPEAPVSLLVSKLDGRVRIAVHDGGEGFVPCSPDLTDPLADSGRGLLIV